MKKICTSLVLASALLTSDVSARSAWSKIGNTIGKGAKALKRGAKKAGKFIFGEDEQPEHVEQRTPEQQIEQDLLRLVAERLSGLDRENKEKMAEVIQKLLAEHPEFPLTAQQRQYLAAVQQQQKVAQV